MADTDSDLSSASDSGVLTLAEFLQSIRLDPGVPILEYVQRLNGAGFFTPKDIFIDTADNIVKECKLPPADVRRIWANAERLQREGKVTSEAHPQHLALGELLKRVSLDKNVPIAQYAEQLTDKGYRVPLDIFEADTIDISSDTGLLSAIARRIKRAVVRHLQGKGKGRSDAQELKDPKEQFVLHTQPASEAERAKRVRSDDSLLDSKGFLASHPGSSKKLRGADNTQVSKEERPPLKQPTRESGVTEADIHQALVAEFTSRARSIRTGPWTKLPGAMRAEDSPLDLDSPLQGQMPLLKSRDTTYMFLVAYLARIFKRWTRRRFNNDADQFGKGLAQMLIVSCSGSGKSTLLEYLPRWLHLHLDDVTLRGELLFLISWAMFGKGYADLSTPEHKKAALDFLDTLELVSKHHLLAVLWANKAELRTTEAEANTGVESPSAAAALRLLYASLTPLEEQTGAGWKTYEQFLMDFPVPLNSMRCRHVMQFLRQVFHLQVSEHLLLAVLIDEGNAPEDPFPRAAYQPPPKEGLTWLKEFLHSLVEMNSTAGGPNNLAIPICVTTRHTCMDLRCTASQQAMAVSLPMPLLTLAETYAVVLNLARRAAMTARRSLPHKLSKRALEAWGNVHAYLGGNPRLLTLFVSKLAATNFVGLWSPNLDRMICDLTINEVPGVLCRMQDPARDLFWSRLATDEAHRTVQQNILHAMLFAVLLDRHVVRDQRVHKDYPWCTWGVQEADCYVSLEHQTPGGDDPALYGATPATSSSDGPAAELDAFTPMQLEESSDSASDHGSPCVSSRQQRQPEGTAGLAMQTQGKMRQQDLSGRGPDAQGQQGIKRRRPDSAPPQQGIKRSRLDSAPPQPSVQARSMHAADSPGLSTPSTPLPARADSPMNRTASAPVPVMGAGSSSRMVQMSPVGPSAAEAAETLTPSKLPLAIQAHMCPEPSAQPGHEPVVPSLGILVIATLLRMAGLFKDSSLHVYSALLDRESALDKEISDANALCLKIMALALLGHMTFSLEELCPGLPIAENLRKKRFLVPYGMLSAGKGVRQGEKISADELKAKIEEIRAAIISSQESRDLSPELSIGSIGTGNDGKDAFIVLVEADGERLAWCLCVQSKQDTGRKPSYDTCRAIFQTMHLDVKGTHRLLELQGSWATWHESKRDKMPACSPSAQQWDETDWRQRFIYAYVSDRLFSSAQASVRSDLIDRGHPWMERVMILCKGEQKAWYGRTGSLLRTMRLAVLKYKEVRNMLWEEA